MSTITALTSGMNGATSLTTINTNFTNLNTDKYESGSTPTFGTTSVITSGFGYLNVGRRTDVTTASALLTFDTSTAGGVWSIQNNAGILTYNVGGTVGSSLGTEKMRLSTSGELMIGSATTAASRLYVSDVAQSNGTTMSRFSSIGTTTNVADTVDTVTIANNFTASSATNQLLTRALFITSSNTITGGGVLENQRGLNIQTNTAASTTTSSLTHIYLETGTTSGTVTNGYGLVIGSLQGSTKYGIYDAVGTSWVNNTGGTLTIGNSAITTSCIAAFTSTTGAVLLPRMNSTARDALTALAGMIIYNTTTSKFQGYNGAWVDFH